MFNIGIHIDGPTSKDTLDLAIRYFKKLNNFTNLHIFTDEDITTHMDMAYLSCFYMNFYTEGILFLNLENFLANQQNIISDSIYLLTSKEELNSHYITKNDLKNIHLLTLQNGDIHEI
jgi:hypothetical protein